jgi:putative endonuclease
MLAQRGWRIVERNARLRYGEIDLVCHDGRAFVFVEVKTRRSSSFVPAVEAVDARKAARLVMLAQAWLALHASRDADWRLCVAAITVGPNGPSAVFVDGIDVPV